MRIPSRLILSGAAASAFLAGCSGTGAGTAVPGSSSVQQPASQSTSVLRPDVPQLHSNTPVKAFVSRNAKGKGGESIIVSDDSNNVVDVFDAAGNETAQLTGFSEPQGLAVDKQGNLYVADTNNSRIQIYAPGLSGSPTTIADTGEYPANVAVDKKGNIAVTNIISTSDGPGSVSFFTKSGSLIATLSSANFSKVLFDGFDAKGNLYIDGTDASGDPAVGEVVGGAHGKTIASLTLGNTLGYPGGIAVTTSGNIAICDQENLAIYTYGAPVNGSLGSPTATTPLTGAGDPIGIAFTHSNKGVWVADATHGDVPKMGAHPDKFFVSSADRDLYPAGGVSKKTILFSHGSEPSGIAISPAAKL
jgi:hypothetical protein